MKILNLKTLSTTTALTAVALLASPMAKAESWNDWVTQDNFTSSAVGNVTTIDTSAAIASGTTLNANIAAGDTVNVNMASSDHIFAVTDVNNATMTRIDGALNSNGNIIIMDVNGVMFGGSSIVNVAGLAAVGGTLVGPNDLTLSSDVTIESGADIQIGNGVAAFLGNNVINNGQIVSTGTGSILLAAGETATFDLFGDNLIEVAMTGNGNITHAGTITTDGKVYMTAAKAEDLVNTVINVNGIVNASSANLVNGEIVLTADTVNINEDLTANKSVNIDALETNLDARIKDGDDNNLDRTKLTGTATAVNVLSNNATIQQGLDIAANNATVTAHDDTYTGNVNIRRAVELAGVNNATINGTVFINTGDVTVRDLTIQNGYDGIDISTNHTGNINILDNIIQNHENDGVSIQYVNGRVTLRGNTIINNGDEGVQFTYIGATGFIDLDDNTIDDNDDNGVEGFSFTNARIINNRIRGNGVGNYGDGVHAYWFNDIESNGNTISGNGDDGYDLHQFGTMSSFNDTITGNDDDGLDLYQFGTATLDNSTISNNGFAGVYASYFTALNLIGNTFSNNSFSGVDTYYGSITAGGNTFFNNGLAGLLMANGSAQITNNSFENHFIGFGAGSNDNGNIVFAGNTSTNNLIGALFESGLIDLTGDTNTFTGGDTGILFGPGIYFGGEPDCFDCGEGSETAALDIGPIRQVKFFEPNLTLVDNTIGTSTFSGQQSHYVALQNRAFFAPGTPTVLDGSFGTYDGLTPNGQPLQSNELARLETGFHHFYDQQDLGLFFFGNVADNVDLPADLEDIFAQIDPAQIPGGNVNLTITGLPLTGFEGAAASLNQLAPAAGDDTDAEDLNNIETAAGDETSTTQCISNALASASSGVSTTFSFGSTLNQNTLSSLAACVDI